MYIEYLLIFTFFIYYTKGSPLNGYCLSDDDCGTIDTYCSNKICVCKENFVVWFDSCVPLTNPRITCKKRHDCESVLGVKSLCTRSGYCACKAFHHLHLGQCVKNRDLHDICEHNHQCYCGADCEDKIACIGRNCTCKPGHKPYRSRRCIYDPENPPPVVIIPKKLPSTSSAVRYHSTSLLLPISVVVLLKTL